MVDTLAMLEIISIIISALIIAWIIIRRNVLCKSAKNPGVLFSIGLAMLFTLLDLFVHELGEMYTIPYVDEGTAFLHLFIILLSFNALMLSNKSK
jgi:hypothetical protein